MLRISIFGVYLMRETNFLRDNKKRWLSIESFLKQAHKISPDELARLFIEVSDDLAYSQTYYPKSKTTKYLNQLTFQLHQAIYQRKQSKRRSPVKFYGFTYPVLIYKNRFRIFYSLAFLLIAVFVGVVSTANDEGFVRYVLGNAYVNKTLANIEKGEPLAVYADDSPVSMFFRIAWNNIKVSFLIFAAGVLASVGSVIIIFKNGLMLGVFQYFFHQHGLLFESASGIWMHGTVEIFSIIIAGAAGLTIGNSILFPGTYPRLYSLQKGALEGVKMVIGLIPFFIYAAFIESFFTRYSHVSPVLSITVIGFSILLILAYFIIYPIIINNRIKNETEI